MSDSKYATPGWHFCLRPIPNHPGYFADITGHIWSHRRGGPAHHPFPKGPRRLKGGTRSKGYISHSICAGSRDKAKSVDRHVLVAAAFMGPRPDGAWVVHVDGNRQNDRPQNLRYMTPNELAESCRERGTLPCGEDKPQAKLTADLVEKIRRSTKTTAHLARDLGTCDRTVREARTAVSWRHVPKPATDATPAQRAAIKSMVWDRLRDDEERIVIGWMIAHVRRDGLVRCHTPTIAKDTGLDLVVVRRMLARLIGRALAKPLFRNSVYRFVGANEEAVRRLTEAARAAETAAAHVRALGSFDPIEA